MNEIKQNENVSKHITHYDPRLVFVFCIIVMTTFPSTGHTLSAIWNAMISFVYYSHDNISIDRAHSICHLGRDDQLCGFELLKPSPVSNFSLFQHTRRCSHWSIGYPVTMVTREIIYILKHRLSRYIGDAWYNIYIEASVILLHLRHSR